MSDNSNNGYNILLTIQIVLLILKMFNLIDWSWWLVCIPIYISLSLTLFAILVILICRKRHKGE